MSAEKKPDVKEVIRQMEEWQQREGPVLGPDLTIRDLIEDGRRNLPADKLFRRGDRIRIRDRRTTFNGYEGEVLEDQQTPWTAVRIKLTIFGRGVPLELEGWMLEKLEGQP